MTLLFEFSPQAGGASRLIINNNIMTIDGEDCDTRINC